MSRRRSLAGPTLPWDRVARECVARVMSPFEDAERSPLRGQIEAISGADSLVAGDLGCGTGPLLDLLLQRFQRVLAIDSSREMLELARRRVRERYREIPERLQLHRAGLAGLGRRGPTVDVGFAINSLIMPEPAALRAAFAGVARIIRPGGLMVAVFPAIESVQAIYRHCWERSLRRSSANARLRVSRRLHEARFDFALGHHDVGYMIQKYYSRDELEERLGVVGFRAIHFDKVVYPSRLTWDGVRWFGGRAPRAWHWFVRCGRG